MNFKYDARVQPVALDLQCVSCKKLIEVVYDEHAAYDYSECVGVQVVENIKCEKCGCNAFDVELMFNIDFKWINA